MSDVCISTIPVCGPSMTFFSIDGPSYQYDRIDIKCHLSLLNVQSIKMIKYFHLFVYNRIERFLEKRRLRVWQKNVKYDVRKV